MSFTSLFSSRHLALGISLLLMMAAPCGHANPINSGCGAMPSAKGHVLGKASSRHYCADVIRLDDPYGTALFRIFQGNMKVFETREAVPCDQCVLHRGETFRGITWKEEEATVHIQHGDQVLRLEALTMRKIKEQWKPVYWDRSIYEPKSTREWFEQVDLTSYLASVQYRINVPERDYCSRHPDDEIACDGYDGAEPFEEACTVDPEAYALEALSYLRISLLACYHTTPEQIDLLMLGLSGDIPIAMPPLPIEDDDPQRRHET